MSSLSSSSQTTLHSIAEHCGVSHVTVWRALRGKGLVHPRTVKRILDYANQVGYQKESDARTIPGRTRKPAPQPPAAAGEPLSAFIPYNNSVLSDKNAATLFWEYVEGLTEAASKTGTRIELIRFDDPKDELTRAEALVATTKGGILDFGLNGDSLIRMNKHNIPYVSLVTRKPASDIISASVRADYQRGYIQAWEHILGLGHRAIAFLGPCNPKSCTELRMRECLAAGVMVDPGIRFVADIRFPEQEGYRGIWNALTTHFGPYRKGVWPTALFCNNDASAHLVALALTSQGLSLPEAISIIGFDNTPICKQSVVGITTVGSHRKKMGAAMLYLLENILLGRPESQFLHQLMPTELIVRHSTAAV